MRDLTTPITCLIAASLILAPVPHTGAAEPQSPWPQFRGPGGGGVAPKSDVPTNIDPAQATWIANLPPAHSSPIRLRSLVVVTACDGKRLTTLAYSSNSGQLMWSVDAPATPIQRVHEASSPAASTPCTDNERVYVYFGSYGLLCYDHEGNEVWRKEIPTPQTLYGMATSPILCGDQLILVLDDDANLPSSKLSRSKVISLNKCSGAMNWEAPRPFHRSGWSTPSIWNHDGAQELVILGSRGLRSYDAATGEELWFVGGFSRETVSVPVTGSGRVYASASMLGGVADDQPDPQPFWDAVMRFDANGDHRLQRTEMTEHFTFPFRPDLPVDHPGFGMPLPKDEARRQKRLDGIFAWTDKDKDGYWTKDEFLGTISFNRGKPNLVAVRPGGKGDVTDSHVAWALHRNIPEIPSPVFYQDRIYLVRDGGILTCVNAENGEVVYRERLGALGHYQASPVIADRHLYLVSQPGVLSVVAVGDEFSLVHQCTFPEPVSATPCIDSHTLYVRTAKRLYAFRQPGKDGH